jgi:hypothetical protein
MSEKNGATIQLLLVGPARDVERFLQELKQRGVYLPQAYIDKMLDLARINDEITFNMGFSPVDGDDMLGWIDFFRWNKPEEEDTNFLWGTKFFLQSFSCIGWIPFSVDSWEWAEACFKGS